MRQQRATLDAERSAFEREREFVREKILREEKRIEVTFTIFFSNSLPNSLSTGFKSYSI